MDGQKPSAHGRVGAIVLAAYEPEPELFRRQLRSIQAQTTTAWECVITVDGPGEDVAELVADIVQGDPRFRVIGDGTRRGFYRNFEHGLENIDPSATWVALSDQDDYWYPEKLATLLPHLDEVSVVSGQARLVGYPSGEVLGRTERRDHGAVMTMLNNQFSGSFLLFDVDLLGVVLPFPEASTRAAAHDHWIAVVAGAFAGTRVVDQELQDYVQHDSNTFGDPGLSGATNPVARVRAAVELARAGARRYEGSSGVVAVLRTVFWMYVGWRQLMAETMNARVGEGRTGAVGTVFGRRRRFFTTLRVLRRGRRDGAVPAGYWIGYASSWIAGILTGGRRLALPRSS